ncbi:amino acid permease [Halobacterium sp. CBA1126]|uniref:amino acid permease n=1 Tax=Halobacterium sp. CBA1126 TaxID=2668074 RepID=UPI0012F8BB78|nr:amino acid permease [Halobacterium sp. CBA1126]MUV61411.1 amino acid permease [Halobacterium sp. CBA1126]
MVEHTRSLGFRVAFALGLGTMIAAGIFSLSGIAVARIGSSAVVGFVIAAAVASLTAASYSEFASIYSENGGGYLFTSRTFESDRLTYFVGASLFLGYTGTTAFYLATMDEWFFTFIIPETVRLGGLATLHLHAALPHGSVGVVTAVLLGALNAQGTEESGSFQVVVTGAKVAVLVAFVGGAVAYAGPTAAAGEFATQFSGDLAGIVSVASLAFITFFGFSAIAASAGEIIEPRKTVPKAIAASIVTVTVLYTFVIVAMVNAPVDESVLRAGETAMGDVAAAFLGPAGQALIVAGAVFSMVSASNASVLAASGIGSLMGDRGQAPRSFARIHREYGTPFWSVTAVTATIVALIVAFVGVFSGHGLLGGVDLATLNVAGVAVELPPNLGLNALTGFATFNLLVPLAVVNVALVYSRRRFPDLDRPLRVPLVPLVPALGVVANLALVTNLPVQGVVVGTGVVVLAVAGHLLWGGAPETEELREVVAETPTDGDGDEEYSVLVPVARPGEAVNHVQVAGRLANARADDPVVRVLTITQLPDQTPNEVARETASGRVDNIESRLAAADVGVDYEVEGHLCRDVGFDIVKTARDTAADLVMMGYPEENRAVTTKVQFDSPCDVAYVAGFSDAEPLDTVCVGAGGGPHHEALLPLVDALARHGSAVHVVRVTPTGEHGTPEAIEGTVAALSTDVSVHQVEVDVIGDALAETAADNDAALLVGATRTRELRRWVLGSTADRSVAAARERDVPVLVYAESTGVLDRAAELLFPVYRYVEKLRS